MLDRLEDLMTIDDALDKFAALFGGRARRTTRDKLLAACREKTIHHVHFGRRRFVSEADIRDWLRTFEAGKRRWENEEKTTPSRSGAGTSPESPDGRASTDAVLTSAQEESVASALVQAIGRKPKKSSPNTSRSTRRTTRKPRSRGRSS